MKPQLILFISLFIFKIGSCQSEQTSSPPSKIKILSWNIFMLPGIVAMKGKLDRAAAIGETLKNSDYDVIIFQEAFHKKSRKRIEELLAPSFPYQVGPANQKLFSFKTNSGLWIFSKHPIVRSQSIIYKNRSGVDAFSRKGALLAELLVNHQLIQVAGTHLQNSGPVWVRQSQCVEFYHRILKPFYKSDVPQIICGDFNINKKQIDEYQSMLHNLNAVDGELSGDFLYTYDRGKNDLHIERGFSADLIDYILLRNERAKIVDRKIVAFRKPWSRHHRDLSDHFALEAQIVMPEVMTATFSKK
ncbi:MAG: sphingomyelin phosphodiesterase [Cyclobacteriaceae bacterium]